jgi:hypothetical protein
MPQLVLSDGGMDVGGRPELSQLFLPSELNPERCEECCFEGLITAETQLHTAAAFEALEDVRQHICMQGTLIGFKTNNLRGVRDATCSAAAYSNLKALVDAVAAEYRAHHAGLLALQGLGDWQKDLQVLKASDLKGLNILDPTAAKTEDRIKSLAVNNDNHEDAAQEEPTAEELGFQAAEHLKGAINHKQQGHVVPWIWLGANLKPSENNGNPKGGFLSSTIA